MNTHRQLSESILDELMGLALTERALVNFVRRLYARPLLRNGTFLTFLPIMLVAIGVRGNSLLTQPSLLVFVGVAILLCDERALYLRERHGATREQIEELMAPAWAARAVDRYPWIQLPFRIVGLGGVVSVAITVVSAYGAQHFVLTAVMLLFAMPVLVFLVIFSVALVTPGPGSVARARETLRSGRYALPVIYVFVGAVVALIAIFVGAMIFVPATYLLRGYSVFAFGCATGFVLLALSRFARWATLQPSLGGIVAAELSVVALAILLSMLSLAGSQYGDAPRLSWVTMWAMLADQPAAQLWIDRGALAVGMMAPLLPAAYLIVLSMWASLLRVLHRHSGSLRLSTAADVATKRYSYLVGTLLTTFGMALISGGIIANRVAGNFGKAQLGWVPRHGADVDAIVAYFAKHGFTIPRILLLTQVSMWCGTPLVLLGWRLRSIGQPHIRENEPFVLYLRAFVSDADKGGTYRTFLRAGLPFRTVEQEVVEQCASSGRVLALGRPDDVLPPLGAERVYVNDSQWQATVLEYMKHAAIVVIRAGDTENLSWELEHACRVVDPEHLVLWFDDRSRRDPSAPSVSFAAMVAAQFPAHLPPQPTGARFVHFDKHWQPFWSDLIAQSGQSMS